MELRGGGVVRQQKLSAVVLYRDRAGQGGDDIAKNFQLEGFADLEARLRRRH